MSVSPAPDTFRNFVRRFLLFTVPLFAAFGGLEMVIDDRPLYEESAVYQKVSDFLKRPEGIRVVVFGSSHADNAVSHADYALVSNLANQGQDLRHDQFIYDLVRDRMQSVDVVALTLSFFSFRYDEERVWPYRTRDYNDAFTAVPRSAADGLRNWVFDRSDLINYNLPLYAILNHYAGRLLSPAHAETGGAVDQPSRALGESAFRHDAVNRAARTHRGYFNVPESATAPFLNRLITDNQHAGRLVVAVVPPFHRTYLVAMDRAQVDSFYGSLRDLQQQYGLRVLDYARDSRFVDRADLFQNSDHLNRAGARFFTATLLNDLDAFGRRQRQN